MADIQPVSRNETVVCVYRAREYSVRDTVDAAILRGELNASWKEFLCRVQAERISNERTLEADDSAINEMAELFCYEHDLITAQETERWLADRGLSLEDFTDYFKRCLS
jgi:hypothetical protein